MARPPSHPSGAAKTISVRLSPDHLRRLDQLVEALGVSRSAVIQRLLERVATAKEAKP